MEINEITGIVLDTCIKIHSAIGPGCFERVYEEALNYDLSLHGLNVKRQLVFPMTYKEVMVKRAYKVDLIIEDKLVIEVKSIAHELGSRNIRCNAIAPGFIETDMTHYLKDGETSKAFLDKIPLGRFGSADEVANTTLFLASDMSSYITGQVISACGGLNI